MEDKDEPGVRYETLRTILLQVFWGSLLVLVDFRLNIGIGGRNAGFDLLPDSLGAFLIAFGTAQLASKRILKGSAEDAMTAVASVAGSLFLLQVGSWFYPPLLDLGGWARGALLGMGVIAVSLFSYSMSSLCSRLGLQTIGLGWVVLAVTFGALITAPALAIGLFPALASNGLFARLAGILVLVPLGNFLYLLWRMNSFLKTKYRAPREVSGLV